MVEGRKGSCQVHAEEEEYGVDKDEYVGSIEICMKCAHVPCLCMLVQIEERSEKIRNKVREEASHGGRDDQGKGVINSQEHELRLAPPPYTLPSDALAGCEFGVDPEHAKDLRILMEEHRTRKQAEYGEGEDTTASAGVGVNPEDDPEHALALRVPMGEQKTRRQAEGGGEEVIAAPPLAVDDPEHALALRIHMEEQRTRRQAECCGEDDIAALSLLLMIVWRKGRKEQDHIW